MTAFIEDYRTTVMTGVDGTHDLDVPEWMGAAPSVSRRSSARRSASPVVRKAAPKDRTRVRTSRRPSNGRPGGVSGSSRRPNTRRMALTSSPTPGVSNTGHVRGGRSVVRGPVQGVRRNRASVAVVAGVGAVFGLMLHFSGLGAPAPDAPPAPTYVGAADAQLK